MPEGTGYCDFHEKVYKASHTCDFFLALDSTEGRAYKSKLYGHGEDDDGEMDELEI
jgi:hypothetical protein